MPQLSILINRPTNHRVEVKIAIPTAFLDEFSPIGLSIAGFIDGARQ
jgi:hypothetical protein